MSYLEMTIAYGALVVALIVGYVFVKLPLIRKTYLPASVAAGLLLLILGPHVAQDIPTHYYELWEPLPALLINVVFATLFLARPLIPLKEMWRRAGPQAAFGQTIAWGYYAMGGLVTMLVLIPLFAASPLTAALIEVSFEGGHGTAAGMIPVFHELDFMAGQEITVALATTSLLCTLVTGFSLLHWGRRRKHFKVSGAIEAAHDRIYHRRIIHELRRQGVQLREEFSLWRLLTHLVLIAVAVGLGFLLHGILLQIETALWGQQGIKIFGYMPVFTFCMFGGMAAQALWSFMRIKVSRPLVELLSAAALSVLIVTAIGTMSLDFLTRDGWIFLILAATGVAWALFCFLVLGPRMFASHWFTNSIISIGQSMGTTATGLLFAQIVDPKQRTGAVEGFGYKQLMFEPLMGGGMVTALSMPLILLLGLPLFTGICLAISLFWMLTGVFYFGRR